MSKRPDYEDNFGGDAKRQHYDPTQQIEQSQYQVFPGLYVNLAPQNQPIQQPIQQPIGYYPPQPQSYGYSAYPPYQAMNAQQALHMQWKPQSYSSYMNRANSEEGDDGAPEVSSSRKQVPPPTPTAASIRKVQPVKQQPAKKQKQKQKPTIMESGSESEEDDLDDEKQHAIQGTNIVLDSAEDIQKWIEERRKNWPTTKRVNEKTSQTSTSSASTTGNICRYFQRTGKCRMGDRCKYSHQVVKTLPNHKVKIVNGVHIQVPQRFTPLTNGGKSLNALLFEGEHFKQQNLKIVDVLQRLADGGHLPAWEHVVTKLGVD